MITNSTILFSRGRKEKSLNMRFQDVAVTISIETSQFISSSAKEETDKLNPQGEEQWHFFILF